MTRVRTLIERGAFAAAERLADSLWTTAGIRDGAVGNEWLPLLQLVVEAKLRDGKAHEPRTRELATRLLELTVRMSGSDSEETARVHHVLGELHFERGEFLAALKSHLSAKTIRAGLVPPDDAAQAETLEYLARSEILLERFLSARVRLDRALAIREAQASAAPLRYAGALELMAVWNRYSGSYVAGLALVERVLTIRGTAFPDEPRTAGLLDLHGDLLFLGGDIAQARQKWSRGLELSHAALDVNHPSVPLFLRKLALAADAVGDRAESRRLLDEAVRIGMPHLPPCHPEVAGLLNDSAQLAQRDGNYAEARRKYRQQLRMLAKCHTNANWTATALHNYASLFFEMGDLAEAERLHRRAVDVWSTRLGPRHSHVARGLDALAEVVAARGQHARARALYQRALRIRRVPGREDQPDVAWTLTNLARTIADLGELSGALRLVTEAIGIYRRNGAFDEPDHLARAMELQGSIQSRQGRLREAGESLAGALAERERIYGPDHPLAAEARARLARVQFLAGRRELALSGALAAERAGRDQLRATVRYLPERQALAYAAKRPAALDLALSVAVSGPTADRAAVFDAVIRSRGIILEELAGRAREFTATDQGTATLLETAGLARQRYANLVVRSMREHVPRALLEEARAQKESAEEALAERSVEARRERVRAEAGLDSLRAALPPGGALVAFVKYNRTREFRVGSRSTSPLTEPSYAAFVQHAGAAEVAFVALGSAETIDALVTAWRDEAAGQSILEGTSRQQADTAYSTAAARLRRAAWDPVADHLTGSSRVFIVPDGQLNVVSFAALPGLDGRFAVEGPAVVHYLSTERDLAASRLEAAPGGLLAVGGAVFGNAAARQGSMRAGAGAGCDQFSRMQFTNLPGTTREVAEISRLWSARKSGSLTVLSGAAATESAVKRALTGQRVVHLATHGFFLETECRFGAPGTRGVGGLVRISKPAASIADNPLLLSGLALVGANGRPSGRTDQDDGILTAEEIAGLHLQGMEWAVLSACNTGLGEIKAGEGVFGLRRAFQIAGARTVIMSLWSVDDTATREWMRALYDGRLNRRLNTADAVREASLAVLRQRRAKGLSTHPFYWAAFVAAGDWR